MYREFSGTENNVAFFIKEYRFCLTLQVDRLEEELMKEQEKLKGITEELERTFAELSGY